MKNIDRNDPNQMFEHDPDVPSGLRWKYNRRRNHIGKMAGTPTHSGGWAVQFRGTPELVHRVIWEMFNGPFDTKDTVRHIDGNKQNNSIDNLRIELFAGKNWQDPYLQVGDWQKVFDYKEGFLYWIGARWSGSDLRFQTAEDGQQVHYILDKDGYFQTKITAYEKVGGGVRHHRIIYEWHYGKIPEGMQIDHIDGDITNNKIENLRCVTAATNARNIKISSRNTTGVLGVRKRVYPNYVAYIAFWREGGRYIQKSFNSKTYGEEEAMRLATEYRQRQIERLNNVYGEEGYHENHGRA